jgi:hypothetical protein
VYQVADMKIDEIISPSIVKENQRTLPLNGGILGSGEREGENDQKGGSLDNSFMLEGKKVSQTKVERTTQSRVSTQKLQR